MLQTSDINVDPQSLQLGDTALDLHGTDVVLGEVDVLQLALNLEELHQHVQALVGQVVVRQDQGADSGVFKHIVQEKIQVLVLHIYLHELQHFYCGRQGNHL